MDYDWNKLYEKYKVLEIKGTIVYEGKVIPDEVTAALVRFTEVALKDKYTNLTDENAEYILVWQLNQIRALYNLKPL